MPTDVANMATFPAEIADTLRDLAKQVRGNERKFGTVFLERGRIAAEAQSLLANHGSGGLFSAWCRDAGLTRSVAYRAIAVYENFGQCRESRQIPMEALTLLARHHDAAEEGRRAIAAGERLTIKAARAILAKHVPPTAKAPKPPALPKGLTIETPRGSITVHVAGIDDRELGQILAHALRQVQERVNSATTATPEEKKRTGWFNNAA